MKRRRLSISEEEDVKTISEEDDASDFKKAKKNDDEVVQSEILNNYLILPSNTMIARSVPRRLSSKQTRDPRDPTGNIGMTWT